MKNKPVLCVANVQYPTDINTPVTKSETINKQFIFYMIWSIVFSPYWPSRCFYILIASSYYLHIAD